MHRNKANNFPSLSTLHFNSTLSTLHSQLLPPLASGLSASAFRRERAKAANGQTPPLVGSGSEGEDEDRTQGGGGRPVRGRRAEARAGREAVFRDEATRRGSAADGAGGRTVPPVGRDEGETGDPRAKTCHARAISPPPAGRTASGRVRIRQDSPPTAYMHTPRGRRTPKPPALEREYRCGEIARTLTRHPTRVHTPTKSRRGSRCSGSTRKNGEPPGNARPLHTCAGFDIMRPE